MSEAAQKFFVTTPIYYVNARPHIGHAYTTIVADVLARRSRAQGTDTFFLTGTDEHGQKIERSAAAAGIPPQQFADRVSKTFSDLWARMGITHDKFIRTTDEAHKRGVQKLWRELQSRGHIYLDSYTGAYCVSDETFVDVPAGAPCPDCGRPTEIVTEENYFFRLSAFQQPVIHLIESGQLAIEPESRRNEVLSFLRGGLKDLSISRSSFTWGIPVPKPEPLALSPKPSSSHVIYVWLDALANYMTALGYGSEDESLWEKYWPADLHIVGKEIIRFHCVYWPAFLLAAGLPTPKKVVAHGWLLFEESKMSKSKGNIVRTETILDAFGTLCPPSTGNRKGTPSGVPQTAVDLKGRGFSPAANPLTESPASAPEGIPTPLQNSVILSERSESKDPDAARPTSTSDTFSTTNPTPHDRDLFAADILRYFLLREIPFGQDGSFSFDALITRYNADLANGYGNLVSRTLSMIHRYCNGEIPVPRETSDASLPERDTPGPGKLQTEWLYHPLTLLEIGMEFPVQMQRALERSDFALQINSINCVPVSTDSVINAAEPWKKDLSDVEGRAVVDDVLYFAAEAIRIYTAALYPILPYATANVWRQLGLGDIEQAAKNGELTNLKWGGLKPGTKLGPLSPIFPRADKGLAQIMTEMESPKDKSVSPSVESVVGSSPDAPPRTTTFTEPSPGTQVAASTAATTERELPPPSGESPTTPTISIDDFIKIDLRVAKILVAERIPKADKLLRLEVDLGYETRQILSGIAEWYTPEELVGRRIVVIVNLAPRKMRGLESHGMLLAASTEGGKPHLATCGDSDDLPLGSRLK